MATIITQNGIDEKKLNDNQKSQDVVDHCAQIASHRPPTIKSEIQTNRTKKILVSLQKNLSYSTNHNSHDEPNRTNATTHHHRRKSTFPSLDQLPIFHFQRKRGGSAPVIHTVNASSATIKGRPAFVKSSSIARLFGNTYNTKQHQQQHHSEYDPTQASNGSSNNTHSDTNQTKKQQQQQQQSQSHHHHPERFHAWENIDFESTTNEQPPSNVVQSPLFGGDTSTPFDHPANPFRSLSRGLGRLFWKKSYSVSISQPDPEFKVAYLGNVLTGWAKGDSCMEKPLATLWRNYTQNYKPDVAMRVKICSSGLKATTRQHGLTEYWSHRITHCSSPKNYPKVFCWIYRHEGRKLKHELRCHAVLCAKESIADSIAKTLQENLTRALQEFKRDKINKQNARLSLVNSVYENPTMPQRKIMLSVGSTNYRPPLERSKSAPRLMVIEETGEEFDDEDDGTTTQDLPPRRNCCTMDPLYPAMTLGRRRCKRGHSIRRTGQRHVRKVAERVKFDEAIVTIPDQVDVVQPDESAAVSRLRIGSDSGDDLDKLLLRKDYDSASPLADELMSYFDMKFNTKITVSMEDLQLEDDQPCYPAVRTSLSLDNLDNYSDEGEDDDPADDLFFSQDHILNTLIRNSKLKSSITLQVNNGDENETDDGEPQPARHISNEIKSQTNMMGSDSDEGSISSGFDTASTVTTNLDIILTKSDAERNHSSLECSSVRTTPLAPIKAVKTNRNPPSSDPSSDSDESDLSDESGYVEYQLDSLTTKLHSNHHNTNRPSPNCTVKSQFNTNTIITN